MTRANYYSSEPARAQPEKIDDLLGSIVERAGAGADLGAARLVASWDGLVAERWLGRSRPIGVRDQTLLVDVPAGELRGQTHVLAAAAVSVYGTVKAVRGDYYRFPIMGKYIERVPVNRGNYIFPEG